MVQLKLREMKSNKVLVLHPNDELKLIGLQDKLRAERNQEENCFLLKIFPLWSEPLSEEIIDAAKDKRILKLSVSGPICKDGEVYCPLSFLFLKSDGSCTSAESRIIILKGNCNPEISGFDFSPRVFRIAEKHEEGNRYWLTDSVWQKLKKDKE